VLFSRAARIQLANASTTKMMTALLSVANGDLDDIVTVSPSAAATGGGGVELRPGERFTKLELLEAMLIESANDAAVALAEHLGGTEAVFVEGMNRLAERLGLKESHFANAHGLDAPGHGVSARDEVKIAKLLLAQPRLRDIVATERTTISSDSRTIALENTNLLLGVYPGLIGVKTGYTSDAGNVLVAAARRHGVTLISVAMHSDDAFRDTRRLLDHGWKRLRAEARELRSAALTRIGTHIAGVTAGLVLLVAGLMVG
jgi:D-alanyl-D-alanine carboxypeptidase (penicillin-binding protein 5/6)